MNNYPIQHLLIKIQSQLRVSAMLSHPEAVYTEPTFLAQFKFLKSGGVAKKMLFPQKKHLDKCK